MACWCIVVVCVFVIVGYIFFFFKQKTAYEMRISDWSSDVCLPISRLKLKQAYGRLLRRAEDYGVFVVLDAQLPSRLLSAFPPDVDVRRIGIAEAEIGRASCRERVCQYV